MLIGEFVRQHDPDFVDGWTISVFDNYFVSRDNAKGSSRIMRYSEKDGRTEVMYQGTPEHPFYSRTMGKHQLLENGNTLITETMGGRAFEIDRDKRIVWEYFNQTGRKGALGLLTEAWRVPPSYASASKLQELAARCHRP